jgi:hypothetical protein
VTLLGLLRDHGDVVEADLQRTYGVDLVDLWRGGLTLRRVRVLLEGLPPDSQTAYALSGSDSGELAGWRLTDVLLGRLADEMALYRWQWESYHLDPKKQKPRKQPPSVLPELNPSHPEPESIPVVSPHHLGTFVNEQEEEPPDGQ